MLGHRELNVDDYLAMLRRRWWVIAVPAVIFTIVGIGATFFMSPRYVSETLVLIDQQKVPDSFVKSVVSENLDGRLASMQEQINSRSSLQPIIEKYNLYADQHMSMDGRIGQVRNNIKIELVRSEISGAGGLPGFKIYFTANDPHTAQQVCDEITFLFTGANLRQRADAARGTTEFLTEQLNESKHLLDDQDKKLADFQRQYFGMQPGDEANNVQVLTTLNSRLEATNQAIQTLQVQRSIYDSQITQQTQMAASPAAVQSPQAQATELDDLLAKKNDLELHYTADYPEVKAIDRKIDDLRKKMAQAPAPPSAATSSASTAAVNRPDSPAVQKAKIEMQYIDATLRDHQKEQQQLQQQIRTYEDRIQSTPQVEEQFKQLNRDAEQDLAHYNALLAESQQASMATALENRQQGETFRVLDEPNLPESPSWPNRNVFAAGGLAGGVALGFLIAALLEYRDTAMRTERDVWAFTQLPTLAVIAWSGGVAPEQPGKLSTLKEFFSRKPPTDDPIVDSPG